MDINQEVFKEMIEASGRLTTLLDLDGRILYANRVALQLIEQKIEDVCGVYFWETALFLGLRSRQIVKNAYTLSLEGKSESCVIEHSKNNGERNIITFTIKPLYDTEGNIVFLMPEASQITRINLLPTASTAERADHDDRPDPLSEIEADSDFHRGDLLISTIYDTVIFFDNRLTVKEVRYGKSGSLFFNSENVVGGSISQIFTDPGLAEKIEEARIKCSHPFGVQAFEYFLVHESIHRYYEGCVAYTPMNEIVVTFINISDKKLAQARIIESQRMDSIGALAGGIAHDFNNMLGGISGYTNLLVTMENDPDKMEYLQLINKAVKRAALLTQDLLAFGRRAKGRVVQIDMNQAVRQVLSIFKYTSGKKINIQTSVEEGIPSITGDPAQINQVLLNLLQNAADAISEKGTISVSAHRVECDNALIAYFDKRISGNFILIEVSDSGEGIDHAVMPNIFEPFFSTKDSNKIEGRGLGLSSVWGIVNDHGGFIDVISQKQRGTSFMIYLPLS